MIEPTPNAVSAKTPVADDSVSPDSGFASNPTAAASCGRGKSFSR